MCEESGQSVCSTSPARPNSSLLAAIMGIPVLLCLGVWGLVQAAVYQVPGNFETIQEAIDEAVDSDIILVLPGTYRENLDFGGKDLIVVAPGGPALTTIDGGGRGACATFRSGESLNCILGNFTLTGGSAGAIRVEGRATPLIGMNVIRSNSNRQNGGAVVVGALGAPTLYRNLILDNHSDGQGGAVSVNGGAVILLNNTLTGNSSEGEGGAFYASLSVGNQIANNIIVQNSSGRGAAIFGQLFRSQVAARYNDVWDNEGGDYENVAAGEGAISSDPLFVDVENGDYGLTGDSPCIDAGDPSLPQDPDGTTADMGCYPYLQAPELQPIAISPELINFGQVLLNSVAEVEVTLLNPNQVALRGVIFMPPESSFFSDDTALVLDAEAEASALIYFQPGEEGEYLDSLRVVTINPLMFGDSLEIPLPVGYTAALMTGVGSADRVEESPPPDRFEMLHCWPNPFNNMINLQIWLPVQSYGGIDILDASGRQVAEIYNGELGWGSRQWIWNPQGLESGTYLVRLSTDRGSLLESIQLIK